MDSQPIGGEEAALIKRAVRGDDRAWELVMRAHQEAVYRFAYLVLGDPDDAEDVAQETFIRAHRALVHFDLARPLRPWLLRIASNQASNRKRSLGRYWAAIKRYARQDSGLSREAWWEPFPAEDRKSLWSAIQDLDSQDQTVIYLRYFLQLSVGETAQALDIASGTVKSRSHRALRRLKHRIETHYPDLISD